MYTICQRLSLRGNLWTLTKKALKNKKTLVPRACARAAAIRGNVHEQNRFAGCVRSIEGRRAMFPCSSSNNEVASSTSQNWFFPPYSFILRSLRLVSTRAAPKLPRREDEEKKTREQSKTGGMSSYRTVRRWVPLRLHLRRASTFCTALNADSTIETGTSSSRSPSRG